VPNVSITPTTNDTYIIPQNNLIIIKARFLKNDPTAPPVEVIGGTYANLNCFVQMIYSTTNTNNVTNYYVMNSPIST